MSERLDEIQFQVGRVLWWTVVILLSPLWIPVWCIGWLFQAIAWYECDRADRHKREHKANEEAGR